MVEASIAQALVSLLGFLLLGYVLGLSSRFIVKHTLTDFVQVKLDELKDRCDTQIIEYSKSCDQVYRESQERALHVYQKALEDAKILKEATEAHIRNPSN